MQGLWGSAAGTFELRRGDGVWERACRQQRGHEICARGCGHGPTMSPGERDTRSHGRLRRYEITFSGAGNNAPGSAEEASEPLGASMAKRPSPRRACGTRLGSTARRRRELKKSY